jgi:hypothetical protein
MQIPVDNQTREPPQKYLIFFFSQQSMQVCKIAFLSKVTKMQILVVSAFCILAGLLLPFEKLLFVTVGSTNKNIIL